MKSQFFAALAAVALPAAPAIASQISTPVGRGDIEKMVFKSADYADTITITMSEGQLGLVAAHPGGIEGGFLQGPTTLDELQQMLKESEIITLAYQGYVKEDLVLVKDMNGAVTASLRGGLWLTLQQ